MSSNRAPSVPVDTAARPPVDPGLQVVLDLVNRPDAIAMSAMSPPEARAAFSMMNGLAGGPLAGVAAIDRTVPGPVGELPVREAALVRLQLDQRCFGATVVEGRLGGAKQGGLLRQRRASLTFRKVKSADRQST